MSYKISPGPYAVYSSALDQIVASATAAYAVVYETVEIRFGITRGISTVTMTNANPGVVTWTAHGLLAGDAVFFTTTGALPTNIVAGTVYWLRTVTANTFTLATTSALSADIDTTAGVQSGVQTATPCSRIVVSEAGKYKFDLSIIADSTGNDTISVWAGLNEVAFNGTSIARSTTTLGLSINIESVVAVPFILDLGIGDVVRFYYCGSATGCKLNATAAAVNPTRPACPSVIISVAKISR
tara:strand:+ start:981 stop:1703 length:723 start_codon:yes stop_codon:yes gene_type:complete